MSTDDSKANEGSNPSNEDSDGGDLSQEQLDALIAEAEQEFTDAGGNVEVNSGTLSQEDLDALVEAHDDPESTQPVQSFEPDTFAGDPPVIEKEAIEDPVILSLLLGTNADPEEIDSSPDQEESFSNQKQLDTFLDEIPNAPGGDDGETNSSELVEDLGLLDQDELNSLIDAAKELSSTRVEKVEDIGPPVDKSIRPADFIVVETDEGVLSQDELDALLVSSDSADDKPEGNKESSDEGDALDQSAIDALLAGSASDTPAEADIEEEAKDEGGMLDQSAIDALLEGSATETPVETDAAEESKDDGGALDQSAIDALLAGDNSSVDSVDDELISTEEELVSQDMDERLDTVSSPPEDQPVLSEEAPVESLEEVPVEEVVDSEPTESIPQEEQVAAVVNENVAAGAFESQEIDTNAAEVKEPVYIPPSEPVEEYNVLDDSRDEFEEVETTSIFNGLTFPPVMDSIKQEPYRAMAGLAAGVLVALSTMLYMTANRLQPPPDSNTILVAMGQGDAGRRLALAHEYVDEKEYSKAIEILNSLIPSVKGSPLELDARFLHLEARYLTLPEKLTTGAANAFHSEIDALVEAAPLHPRKAHALYWKGKIYEKENNILAARVEYREMLRNEGNAINRDVVLLSLAELELNTGRPVQSARYLQQLRREHADSPLAEKAQLLLGDAYGDAGDDEQARNLYIRIAQNNPGNKIGAEAFTKLGELAYDTGNYDRAIADLETRLHTATSVEGNDKVTLMLAKAYRAADRLEDAQNTLKGLLDFFPESDITPLASIELSQIMEESGQIKEAVRYASQTAQRYPDNPDVLRNAGEMLAKAGDSREAARVMVAAEAAGADDPELLLAAGKLYRLSGSTKNAHEVLQHLSEKYPGTEQGFLGSIELSRVLYEEGKPTKAAELLNDLVRSASSPVQRLKLLDAQGELYSDMVLPLKVAEVYSEIASMTEEPEMLAKSALALLRNRQYDEGLMVASRVDTAKLSAKRAYELLNAHGKAMLLVEPRKGVDILEQAHAGYPAEQTASSVQTLLEANLTLGRSARARAIVAELQTEVARTPLSMDRVRLERAAITWGDYLFERKDYRSAVDAYATALGIQVNYSTEIQNDAAPKLETEGQQWASYQLANAQFRLMDFSASIIQYDQLARTNSKWATEAGAKAQAARLELRLRGEPVSETRNAG